MIINEKDAGKLTGNSDSPFLTFSKLLVLITNTQVSHKSYEKLTVFRSVRKC